MFYHNINPTLIKIGELEIRYYGLIFLFGIILSYFLTIYLAKKSELKIQKNQISDLIFYLIIGIVLFSRLFYVLIYNLKYYLTYPYEIIAIWHGGLSFHGGLVGAIIVGYIYCKKKGLNFYKIADIMVIPAALALSFGRIANFINGELVGRITDVPWAVKFPNYEGFRHPSQLYEAAKNLAIFFILYFMKIKNKIKDGLIFWSFIILYASLRFFIEFFREPDFLVYNLTPGQLLCLIMFVIGVIGITRVLFFYPSPE